MPQMDIEYVQREVIRAIQEGDYPRAHSLIAAVVEQACRAEQYEKLYKEQKATSERLEGRIEESSRKLPSISLSEQSSQVWELEEVTDVTYDDIGGLDEQIMALRETIELPFLYSRLFGQYDLKRPTGILLYGPSGCGKTMLAKAVASSLTAQITRNFQEIEMALLLLLQMGGASISHEKLTERYLAWHKLISINNRADGEQFSATTPEEMETKLVAFLNSSGVASDDPAAELERYRVQLTEGCHAYFMKINGAELLKYGGETEYSIRTLFSYAKHRASSSTPVIMYFYEIDTLFRRQGLSIIPDVESSLLPQFLAEIDDIEDMSHIIVIGAADRYDLVDPAMLRPGRLDVKIRVDRPSPSAARDIMGKYFTPHLPIDEREIHLAGSKEKAIQSLINRTIDVIYDPDSPIVVHRRTFGERETWARDGSPQCRSLCEMVTGAMLASIVEQAKRNALWRELESTHERGIDWHSLRSAIRREVEERRLS